MEETTTEATGFVTLPKGAKPSKSLSKDAARPGLQVAKVAKEKDEWVLYTCDSFQLARLPLHVEGENAIAEGIIPAEALKVIEKAGAFRANGTIEPVDKYGRSLGQTFERPDESSVGRVADYKSVIPDAPKPSDALTIGFSAKKILELAQSLGANPKDAAIFITLDASKLQEHGAGKTYLRAMRVSTNTGNESQGVLMPIRPA